jgi:hypothetical protein
MPGPIGRHSRRFILLKNFPRDPLGRRVPHISPLRCGICATNLRGNPQIGRARLHTASRTPTPNQIGRDLRPDVKIASAGRNRSAEGREWSAHGAERLNCFLLKPALLY